MLTRILYCSVRVLILTMLATTIFAQDEGAVPIELRHGMPFVQVMVNGQGPFTFGIDTGSGGEAMVSPALAQKLALPSAGETEIGDPSGQNSHRVPVFRITTLKVAGGVEFRDIQAAQHQPSPREGQYDGILGFLLFHDYLFSLDYPHEQMKLSYGSLTPDDGKTVVPFTMPHNVPLIELRVGTKTIGAHIDSGGMGLSFPQEFAKGLAFASEPVVLGRGHTISSDFEIKGAQLADEVKLAGYTFAHSFVEINPVFPVANFGSIPLRHFAVTFDQKNKLVRFVAVDRTIVIAPPRMGPGPAPQSGPEPTPTPQR